MMKVKSSNAGVCGSLKLKEPEVQKVKVKRVPRIRIHVIANTSHLRRALEKSSEKMRIIIEERMSK